METLISEIYRNKKNIYRPGDLKIYIYLKVLHYMYKSRTFKADNTFYSDGLVIYDKMFHMKECM